MVSRIGNVISSFNENMSELAGSFVEDASPSIMGTLFILDKNKAWNSICSFSTKDPQAGSNHFSQTEHKG